MLAYSGPDSMQLVSPEFLLLFLLAAAVQRALPRRFRWVGLCLTGGVFYYGFASAWLALLLLIILLDYGLALKIERRPAGRRRGWLTAAVTLNIGVLAFFKLGPLTAAAEAAAARFLGLRGPEAAWAMPLGLSFFIFTSVGYLVEVKRGRIPAERHPGYLAAYLLYFPKLAQGPIERPQDFLPQLHRGRPLAAGEAAEGLRLILMGCFKKTVIADRLGLYVNVVFGNEPLHNGSSLLLAVVLYAFQIYADFSAYTDLARGLSLLLGLRLSPNFRQPYLAVSIKDFWSRWHMTLSTWLRDYLFLPLSFAVSRRLPRPRYLGLAAERWIYAAATAATFLVAGAWHGEGWGFIVWGLLFGAYLIAANVTAPLRRRLGRRLGRVWTSATARWARRGCVFALVSFAWIFFRAGSLPRSLAVIRKILFNPGPLFIDSRAYLAYSLLAVLSLFLIDLRAEAAGPAAPLVPFRPAWARVLSYALILTAILAVGVLDGGQFIYFQF